MFSLLVVLAIIGMFQQGVAITLLQILIAISVTSIIDISINYIKHKKIIFPSSALITGIIIALVLSPGIRWFIPLIASFIAILQKHIIRYKGRHIFNPANFGLLTVLFIPTVYVGWWGQSYWPLLVLVGIFICFRMKRIEIPFIFIGCFVLLFGLHNILLGQPFLDSFLLINIFFVFVMLIEPKTSPIARKGRIIYAVLTALFSFAFFDIIPQFDFSILSLAIVNISVPFLNKIR
jgi:Na+-translocating ferredoxin:NAD+ oxidoreductase RnfD subunit